MNLYALSALRTWWCDLDTIISSRALTWNVLSILCVFIFGTENVAVQLWHRDFVSCPYLALKLPIAYLETPYSLCPDNHHSGLQFRNNTSVNGCTLVVQTPDSQTHYRGARGTSHKTIPKGMLPCSVACCASLGDAMCTEPGTRIMRCQ